ncbi:transcriptional regulator, XRE family [Desulfuromonas soudanensis]|uniref:Transcriptional regulator, XRE family n=1 Tax=Desulfuromonas soudanensis TaxID=1603606 RepID=A0A0M3QG99_9BACT|nr:helix-turn-helix transcriptional regulator [Desulfuromonas soudanensis]ALC17443.1 transcriptional regulator, XRE family [Desulfuromonas soudanensis]
MSQSLPPTVCLDGFAVRLVREDKKLTQLYVAKVVGVTTDTISRWENNRYPSIKRENALRLAEALEVPVEEILQGRSGECTLSEPEVPRRRFFLVAIPLVLGLALLAASYFFYHRQELPETKISGERILPPFAAPGMVIPVRVWLLADAEMTGFILREHFPRGWNLIESSPPPSSLDNEKGTARWIVKPGEPRRVISYLVKVDPDAVLGSRETFSGEIVANPNGRSVPMPVGGREPIEVAPYQWADLNGDNIIDDGEMLQASDTVDEMKGVHLDWKLLENIWDTGGYRWDLEKQLFLPSSPLPEPPTP